jgi:hypothetical protein
VNDVLEASPVVPVTVTMYCPLAPDATVNEPDTVPADTAQDGFEMRPLGDDEMVHPVSAKAKPEPKTATTQRIKYMTIVMDLAKLV